MFLRPTLGLLFLAGGLAAQDPPQAAVPPTPSPNADGYALASGTKVPLGVINSISTRSAQQGDRVYLETVFPVLTNGRIVIPVGSWVSGTVTDVKKPGRGKGRAELYLRFDTLTLPNGVQRNLWSRMDNMDAGSQSVVDRTEGKITGEGNTGTKVKVAGEATAVGAELGSVAGRAVGHSAAGLGVGAAAGAAGGLVYIMTARAPDAVIAKGATIEMVLDRPISFHEKDLDFSNAPPRPVPLAGSSNK